MTGSIFLRNYFIWVAGFSRKRHHAINWNFHRLTVKKSLTQQSDTLSHQRFQHTPNVSACCNAFCPELKHSDGCFISLLFRNQYCILSWKCKGKYTEKRVNLLKPFGNFWNVPIWGDKVHDGPDHYFERYVKFYRGVHALFVCTYKPSSPWTK